MSRKNFNRPENKPNRAVEKKESVTTKKEELSSNANKYWEKKYEKEKRELIFGNSQFIIIGIGLVLVITGFLLMSGGSMPDDKWDTGQIYSFTRITLAPFVVLFGLATVGYAIFYNGKTVSSAKTEEEQEQ